MTRITISKYLIVLLTLPLMWSCKKDKDPVPTNQNPPAPTLREASFQAEVSGDFEETISFNYNGTTTETGLTGFYKSIENELSIYALQNIGSNIRGINFRSQINAVSIGTHSLGNFSWGNTTYENTELSTGSFTVQSGTIEFTNVENVPAGLYGFLEGKYVTGTFSMSLSNSNSQNVIITGSFSDIGVVFEN
jgi:hypothetical protein